MQFQSYPLKISFKNEGNAYTYLPYRSRNTTIRKKKDRRKNKIEFAYVIIIKIAPDYFQDLKPPTIQSITIFPLRNDEDIAPFVGCCLLLKLIDHRQKT